jgi:hypothetical protein
MCQGAWAYAVGYPLVIILIVNDIDMTIDKLKHNAPVTTDIDHPLLVSTAFKGM